MFSKKRKYETIKEELLDELIATIHPSSTKTTDSIQVFSAINTYLSNQPASSELSLYIFQSLSHLLVKRFDLDSFCKNSPNINNSKLIELYLTTKNKLVEASKKVETHKNDYTPLKLVQKYIIQPCNTLNNSITTPKLHIQNGGLSFKTLFYYKIFSVVKDKNAYNEFLKVLNLYNQQLIDANTLILHSESFLKDQTYLIDIIKLLVGHSYFYKKSKDPGPSYKNLKHTHTKSFTRKYTADSCMVLNEKWLSHPTWASERSEFIYHKKNTFEEELYHIEEERHQITIDIETNLSLINQLKPISLMLEKMSEADKDNLTLPFRLGGDSIALPRRALKKVYDARRSIEVLEALHTHPSIAVPVVIKRLEQKDKEWRKLREDLKSTWRERESKIFYKSLDHRSATIKSQDRRYHFSKFFINELLATSIESKKFPFTYNLLKFDFSNLTIISDLLKLLYICLDKYSYQSSQFFKQKYEKILNTIFTALCGLDTSLIFTQNPSKLHKDSSLHTLSENSCSDKLKTNTNISVNNIQSMNLVDCKHEKNCMTLTVKKPLRELSKYNWPTFSQNSNMQPTKLFWDGLDSSDFTIPKKGFFCDSNIYTFIRIIVLIYTRFNEFFEFCSMKSLDTFPKYYPSTGNESQTIKDLGLEYFDDYNIFINLTKQFCLGRLSTANYEDLARYILGTKAYLAFSIDKLISSAIKNLIFLSNNTMSSSYIDLFSKYTKNTSNPLEFYDQYQYFLEASKIAKNDTLSYNFINVYYCNLSKHFYFDMIEPPKHQNTSECYKFKSWIDYLSLFISSDIKNFDEIENHISFRNRVFLKKNLQRINTEKMQIMSIRSSKMFLFSKGSYKLKFIDNSFDFFINHSQRLNVFKTNLSNRSKIKWNSYLNSKINRNI
ncbi:hypothetical protein BB561_006350 [Smittium simulii]|uniref:Histone deacetylase interacting domain-containing protein n=1 Tax=Smittium simulii TaxID=133385 RepID=A0A2T9Y520_9FUNG|nr:hypothetical protein BB561_006350 [Smittium simulii]